MIRRPPRSTLFPYPTLSRSVRHGEYRPRLRMHRGGGSLPAATVVGIQMTPGVSAIGRLSGQVVVVIDRKSTRLNSSHSQISYAVFCLKKKKNQYVFSHL